MSRTLLGLALGVTLLLSVVACSSQPADEAVANVEDLEVASSNAGDEDVQSSESNERPIVTVNRSPT